MKYRLEKRGGPKMLMLGMLFLTLFLLPLQNVAGALSSNASGASIDLWVDAAAGNDANDGSSPERAFRSIQAAAEVATPGTTIHILPGVYRESVTPKLDGTASKPILYEAQAGPGTVFVRGSTSAASLPWKALTADEIGLPAGVDPANIYYADLYDWRLKQTPRFIVELNEEQEIVSRLMPAREPDLRPDALEWKDTEYWWLANGGSAIAGCDPVTDRNHQCDEPWRSFTELTDTYSDTDPADIESGNLTTLGNLNGATLVAMDAQHAIYVYHRTIISHDVPHGRVTVSEDSDNDGGPGLGWGSKYYVENHPALLDQPGEWWFDSKSGHLYVWPPQPGNPARLNLEISRLDTGFDLSNRSYITLDGLTVEFFNQEAYRISNADGRSRAFGDTVRNAVLRYDNEGIVLYEYTGEQSPPTVAIDGFTLEDSEVSYMDTSGIDSSFWWPDAPSPARFDHSGVRNVVIRNNDIHHIGFNSDVRSAVAVRVFFPDRWRFEGNRVHDTAQAGAHFHLSLIDSPKQYAFSPQEIKLGNILVADNIFEKACLRASDCGALKFGGSDRPYTHVFRDVLITGNVFRDTIGWSYVSTLRGSPQAGDGNGLYIDYASGIHAYRNVAYSNTGAGYKLSCLWRDGDIILYNNIVANNGTHGFKLTAGNRCDDHNGSVNTQIQNNMLVNNGADGIQLESAYDFPNFGNMTIDHNLYYQNGWNGRRDGKYSADLLLFQGGQDPRYFHTPDEIRAGTPWEAHGVELDPAFVSYDPADHGFFDDSLPDFRIRPTGIGIIDAGTTELPASLSSLLAEFNIPDPRIDLAFDLGRYETKAAPVIGTSMPTPKPQEPAGSTCWPLPAAVIVAQLVLSRFRRRTAAQPDGHKGSIRPSGENR